MYDLALIDVSNFVYRMYFSINKTGDFEDKQELKKAVIRTMESMKSTLVEIYQEKLDEGELYLIFDSPTGKDKRLELYPEYKGTRRPKPEAIKYCLKLAETKFHSFKKIRKDGLEADDVIARIVENNPEKRILIVSTDGDMEALIRPNVDIYKSENYTLTEEKLREKLGTDKNLKDFIQVRKALMGDGSDNIKGVSGIGVVKSLKLVNSVEGDDLYNGVLEKLNDKQKEEFEFAYKLIKFQ